MKTIELLVPKMGEGIIEVNIIKWLKKEGDSFKSEEPLVELATDKVDSELPAPYSGIIDKFLVREGENVAVGSPLAILKVKNSIKEQQANVNNNEKVDSSDTASSKNNILKKNIKFKTNRKYSPLILNIARASKLEISELDAIYGSAKGGRLIKDDILEYLKIKNNKKQKNLKFDISVSKEDKEIKLDRIRKLTAKKMAYSNKEIPHVISFVEADITQLVDWRLKNKLLYKEKYGVSLTFTPIFIWAIAKALKIYPLINSHFSGTDTLVQKKNINIGIAVSLEENNLVIPVIKNADKFSLNQLALNISELVQKARNKNLKPEDISGATYSVSNIGVFDTLMGTPMITPPQIAVMAIGTIKKIPAIIKTSSGNKLEERDKIILSHSYDHRVIDGALGGLFAKEVANNLERFTKIYTA